MKPQLCFVNQSAITTRTYNDQNKKHSCTKLLALKVLHTTDYNAQETYSANALINQYSFNGISSWHSRNWNDMKS